MKAIAAISINNVIGNAGKIPWHCKEDFQWFKRFTMGQNLVVGRTTFETLPYLAGRKIWILANKPVNSPVLEKYNPDDIRVVNDIDFLPNDAIIAGGAKVYESLLPYCDELLLTVIHQNVEGDTFFPPYRHLFSKSPEILEQDIHYRIFKFTR